MNFLLIHFILIQLIFLSVITKERKRVLKKENEIDTPLDLKFCTEK